MTAEPLLAGLVTGMLAGLALTLPFGALGALLLDTAIRSTRRVAVSAAAGVAMTDFCFALVAALTGAAVSTALAPWQLQVQLGSALLVLGLGLHALRSARSVGDAGPLGPAGSSVLTERAVARRTMVRFVAITATNPLTTLTLTAMSAGLASGGTAVSVGFAVGCGAVSVCWHGLLALGGQAVGSRLGSTSRATAAYAGGVITVAMAVRMALAA